MLGLLATPNTARAGDPLKPYVVLVLDVSGSMDGATGSGPPSCGGVDSKLDHARCAIRKIVNSYGDMVFGLGRFRMAMSGTTTANTFPAGCSSTQTTCNATSDAFELLTPLVDGNNDAADAWVNLTGNTCTATGTDPEIWNADGNTPLEGSLNGTKLYWQGTQTTTPSNFTIWPNNLPGFAPIAADPTKDAFLPKPNKPATCNSNRATCDDSAGCASQTNCCCAEQCRPYITILLTDGVETCNGTPASGATSMLTTDVTINGTTRRYRIETKPIGFGINPGDAQIEGIAHGGGATDVSGVDEGFYASDEASLQLAISSILDDAIKTETCNDLDDDCDGAVDEDFEPAKNDACDNGKLGVCRRTGTRVCKTDGTGLTCNAAVGPNGSTELCNLLDDDCDGKVDEGLVGCTCSPQQEQCNGKDDDCDGRIDEASTNGPKITRPCGTGTCQGVETCNFVQNCGPLPGAPGCSGFGGCTAKTPTTETCNGLDDNCDGIRDGFQADCSTMNALPPENFLPDDPRNNPGHPSNNPIPENICHPGFKVCPANVGPPNSFQACTGEVKPCNVATNNTPDSCNDGCNGLDDDCDNAIDEDFAPADCSSDCGVGTTECKNGVLSCTTVVSGTDDNCNGIDDNCDGNTDEGYACDDATAKPGFPATCNPKPFSCDPSPTCTSDNCCCACACTGSGICNGVQSCVNGAEVCQGAPVSQESCDCSDNNCNGKTDEGNLCAAGSICNQFCQCAFSCSSGEFPCPLGKFCKQETASCSNLPACKTTANCVGADCCGVNGPPTGFSDPRDVCTQDPARTNCTCRSLCIADPCFGIVCPAMNGEKQVCQVNAAGDQFSCVSACSVANCAPLVCIPETGECKPDDCTTFPDRCADNQNCIAGVCVTNLCKDVTCPTDQYCAGGNCVLSCADVECPSGKRCRLGVCEDDPCGAQCPFGQACNDSTGECVTNGCGSLNCPTGQYCNPNNNGGVCEDDLCVGTACPSLEQICLGGTCFDPDDLTPDGGVEVRVTAGGGGCSTGGDTGWLLLGIALLFVRRRKTGGRS